MKTAINNLREICKDKPEAHLFLDDTEIIL